MLLYTEKKKLALIMQFIGVVSKTSSYLKITGKHLIFKHEYCKVGKYPFYIYRIFSLSISYLKK